MQTFALPGPICGDQLAVEIGASVCVVGNNIRVDVEESDRTRVQGIINAHAPAVDYGMDPTLKQRRDALKALKAKNGNLTAAEVKDGMALLLKHVLNIP